MAVIKTTPSQAITVQVSTSTSPMSGASGVSKHFITRMVDTVDGFSDVSASSPANSQVLIYLAASDTYTTNNRNLDGGRY